MLVSIGLLGISLNLDALCVGLTYGIRKIKIPWTSKFILFLLSCGFSYVSIFCGRWLMHYFPPDAAKWIGASILFCLGVGTVIRALLASRQKEQPCFREFDFTGKHVKITIRIMKKPECCDMDDSCAIEPKEALYLGVALSVDALAAGIAASMNGLYHLFLPFVIAFFQFLFLSGGRFLGERFKERIRLSSQAVNVAAGIMLIGIALLRIWI